MSDRGNRTRDAALREALAGACRELGRRGLSHGTSGNVSVRRDQASFYVSPTGIAGDALEPAEVALVEFDGSWSGSRRPSSEWRFHREIFRSRADAGAIVHTHSQHATALACTRRGIPAFHYMVAVAGGADIRCAAYHTFGSPELAQSAVTALRDRTACLLANHGLIAMGADLRAAVALADEVENLAAQYCAALVLGNVQILPEEEMRRVGEKFRTYGRQDALDPELRFRGEGTGD
ncbi:MAG TPA: class II aldolase/adducin family protein [Steroidobacteraceae bacterium]